MINRIEETIKFLNDSVFKPAITNTELLEPMKISCLNSQSISKVIYLI